MLKNNTFEEIWEVLKGSKKVIIPLHLNPDIDSIGSAIASSYVLEKEGISVSIVSVDTPDLLSLSEGLVDIQFADIGEMDLSGYDVFLGQDIAIPSYFSRVEDFKTPNNLTVVNIDHHSSNPYYGDYNYIDEKAGSTAGILTDFYLTLGKRLPSEVATALYAGIVADTGWFSFNPPAKAYETAARLVNIGVDSRAVRAQFDEATYEDILYKGRIYSRLTLNKEFNFVYTWVTYEDLEEFRFVEKRQPAIVNDLKYIAGIDFGIEFTEYEPNMVKGSMRSREATDFDVARIAEAFGGGGHKAAAGFGMKDVTIEEAIHQFTEKLKQI